MDIGLGQAGQHLPGPKDPRCDYDSAHKWNFSLQELCAPIVVFNYVLQSHYAYVNVYIFSPKRNGCFSSNFLCGLFGLLTEGTYRPEIQRL